jgi:hypothetical protein
VRNQSASQRTISRSAAADNEADGGGKPLLTVLVAGDSTTPPAGSGMRRVPAIPTSSPRVRFESPQQQVGLQVRIVSVSPMMMSMFQHAKVPFRIKVNRLRWYQFASD